MNGEQVFNGEATAVFQYMPPGRSVICASVNGKPGRREVVVDAKAAERLQRDLEEKLAAAAAGVKARPCGLFDHKDGAASLIPQRFRWDDRRGVLLEAVWTDAGRAAVEGRNYSYWSPSFRLSKGGEVVGLQDGVEVGSLVNNPAFETIEPVAASKAEVDEPAEDDVDVNGGGVEDSDASNPYGCNQYGHGFKQEHEGYGSGGQKTMKFDETNKEYREREARLKERVEKRKAREEKNAAKRKAEIEKYGHEGKRERYERMVREIDEKHDAAVQRAKDELTSLNTEHNKVFHQGEESDWAGGERKKMNELERKIAAAEKRLEDAKGKQAAWKRKKDKTWEYDKNYGTTYLLRASFNRYTMNDTMNRLISQVQAASDKDADILAAVQSLPEAVSGAFESVDAACGCGHAHGGAPAPKDAEQDKERADELERLKAALNDEQDENRKAVLKKRIAEIEAAGCRKERKGGK